MQVIIKRGGPDAAMYFRTEDDLAVFKAALDDKGLAPTASIGLLSYGGLRVMVATADQWAAMEAVAAPADANSGVA